MEGAGFRPALGRRRRASPLLSQVLGRLDRARSSPGARCSTRGATDGRLVARGARRARRRRALVELARRAPPGRCSRRSARSASSGSTPTRPRRSHAAWAGPTIVTTGTASGKSLCFNLPTLRRPLPRSPRRARSTSTRPRRSRRTRRARSRAFGLTKRVRPAIYDGDTPREARARDPPPREPRAHQPRHAARRASSPTTPPGPSCSRTSRSS